MASISISRLAAMDGAQRNIEQRLSELRSDHHRLRHTEITKELLDVIAGYETIRGTDGGDGRGATAAQGR
jgi:F-type H+-transporting ATPase subunit gamma